MTPEELTSIKESLGMTWNELGQALMLHDRNGKPLSPQSAGRRLSRYGSGQIRIDPFVEEKISKLVDESRK